MPRVLKPRRSRAASRFVKTLFDEVQRHYGDRINLQPYARDGFFLRAAGYHLSVRADNRAQVVLGMDGRVLRRHVDHADDVRDMLLAFLDAEVCDQAA